MDLEALKGAGLYDPADAAAAERLELLQFLTEEGCSVEEMTLAHARGRLFALAGDRRIRPLVGLVSLRAAAQQLGSDPTHLAHAWRTFGLSVPDLDTGLLTETDVAAMGTYLQVEALLGSSTAGAFARVVGGALSRITDAESAAMRSGIDAVSVDRSGSEVVTARAFNDVTRLIPQVGALLDTLHRQHLEATRLHFEDIDRESAGSDAFRCGVGFADLSGFTQLSRELPLATLSQVLSRFEADALDTVHACGGRVVKFLGDAVMWVSAAPLGLVEIADAMVRHPHAAAHGLQIRAGVAFGSVLAQDGDYFGPPVNLAARLVSAAEPGQVLTASELPALLPPTWLVTELPPLTLRGFDGPVTPYSVQRV